MVQNFMKELDNANLDKMLDDTKHQKQMEHVHPNDDYSKWQDLKSTVQLMNVKYDSSENVVLWKSEEQRDKYFDNYTGDMYKYETNWNLLDLENFAPSLGTYQGSIIAPLPLEQALGYNYVYIDRYQQPVDNDEKSPVRTRFFFFITGVKTDPQAPNTTTLIIELDAWTEYACEGFEGLAGDLERGHWAMDKITTDEYLSNPLNCDINLFEDEPTLPSLKKQVTYEKLVAPYDDPVIIVASVMDLKTQSGFLSNVPRETQNYYWLKDYDQSQDCYSVSSNLNDGYLATVNPTFSGELKLSSDDPAYSPVSNPQIANQNITNTYFYIVELDEWDKFLETVTAKYPQVLDTILSVFVVPRKFVNLGEKFTSTIGIELQFANQKNSLTEIDNLKITKDLFNYKEDFTKSYTSQFSEIEISNLNGDIAKLNIEDTTGTLQFLFRANTTYPFLKFEGFVNGVGGSVENKYTLKPLLEQDYSLYSSKWEDYRFTWNIPTYAIFQDAKSYSYKSINDLIKQKNFASLDYQNQLAELDKQKANSENDYNTAFNIGTKNANLTKNNTLRSLENTKDNAKSSNDNTKQVATRDNENTQTISNRDNNNQLNNATLQNQTQNNIANRTNENTSLINSIQNTYLTNNFNNDQSQLADKSRLALSANVAGAVAGIFITIDKDGNFRMSPTGGSGDILGAVNKAGVAGLDAVVTIANTNIDSGDQKAKYQFNQDQMNDSQNANFKLAKANNDDTFNATNTVNKSNFNNEKQDISDNFNTQTQDINDNYNTQNKIIDNNYNTGLTNTNDTYNNEIENLGTEKAKSQTNLNNDLAQGKNDAKINYQKELDETKTAFTNLLNGSIKAQSENTGDGTIDAWGQRGIDVRINRISKADEIVVNNEFKRYGYTMPNNTWIKSPTFEPIGNRKYSYWEFRDIFSWSTKMSETSKRVICEILKTGVTIWDNPEDVQKGII